MRGVALIVMLAVAGAGCAFAFDDEKFSANYDAAAVSSDTSLPTEDASCTGDEVRCGGACVSLSTATNHCGACDNDCAEHGSSSKCVAGKCACPGDRCPATGDTFVCSNRSEDPLNCGACGNKCADGEYCKAGACACMPPLVRCSSTSGCVDIGGHHEYCGSCSLRCSAADNTCRATAPLSDYKCTLDSYGCPTGRTHCNGDHCFDTKIDETNCGGCGFKCTSNQVCANGICRAYRATDSSCGSGEADCAPLPGNSLRICVAGGLCPG